MIEPTTIALCFLIVCFSAALLYYVGILPNVFQEIPTHLKTSEWNGEYQVSKEGLDAVIKHTPSSVILSMGGSELHARNLIQNGSINGVSFSENPLRLRSDMPEAEFSSAISRAGYKIKRKTISPADG